MSFRLIRAHRGKGNAIILWGKDEDGRKFPFVEESFRPYFYVKEEEAVQDEAIVGSE